VHGLWVHSGCWVANPATSPAMRCSRSSFKHGGNAILAPRAVFKIGLPARILTTRPSNIKIMQPSWSIITIKEMFAVIFSTRGKAGWPRG